MYALSIAFIVFVFVAASQEVQTAEFTARQALGSPVVLEAPAAPQPPETLLVIESALAAASRGHGAAWARAARTALDSQPSPVESLQLHRAWASEVTDALRSAVDGETSGAASSSPGASQMMADAWRSVPGIGTAVRWVSRSGIGNSRRGLGSNGWFAVSSRFESRALGRLGTLGGTLSGNANDDDGTSGDGALASALGGGAGSQLKTD